MYKETPEKKLKTSITKNKNKIIGNVPQNVAKWSY